MSSPAERPSVVVSIFAGMSALAAVPLAFVWFGASVSSPQEAWLEGGWPMYALLALGGLASVVNALGAFFLSRGTPIVAGVGIFLSLLAGAVGAFGYRSGMTGSFQAIAHAAPMDRAIIMNGATGESMMCLVLGASMVGALFLALGLGALIAAAGVKSARGGFLLFGLGELALGVWQLFLARGYAGEAEAFKALAHAGPMDVATILFGGLEDAQAARGVASFALLGVVACCLAAGALLRANPRALAGVVGGLLVAAAGLGGLRPLARPTADELALLSRPAIGKALRTLDGTPVDQKDRFLTLSAKELLVDDGSPATELPRNLESAKDFNGVLNLRLEPDVTRERLIEQLALMRDAEVRSVRLIGMVTLTPPPGLEVPAPFTAHVVRAAGVRLLLAGEASCRGVTCDFASLGEKGLTVGNETFPLVTKSEVYDGGEATFERAIHLEAKNFTLEQLLSAAHTAAGQGRFLALHFP